MAVSLNYAHCKKLLTDAIFQVEKVVVSKKASAVVGFVHFSERSVSGVYICLCSLMKDSFVPVLACHNCIMIPFFL